MFDSLEQPDPLAPGNPLDLAFADLRIAAVDAESNSSGSERGSLRSSPNDDLPDEYDDDEQRPHFQARWLSEPAQPPHHSQHM